MEATRSRLTIGLILLLFCSWSLLVLIACEDAGTLATGAADGAPDAADAWTEDASPPDVDVSDGTVADTAAPDVAAADGPAPDVSAADVSAPDVTAPDVTAPDVSAPDAGGAQLLFKSGFEPDTAYSGGLITGLDNSTGFSWPISAWSGSSEVFLFATDHLVELQNVTGPTGTPTTALYQQVSQFSGSQAQVPLQWYPGTSNQTDLYTSAWFKLQPDLMSQLENVQINGLWANWRVLWEWKTGDAVGYNAGNGDYRIIITIVRSDTGLYWSTSGDNNANGDCTTCPCCCQPTNTWGPITSTTVPVPTGIWFRLETFTHRSNGSDGRFWAKVDGQLIVDRYGPNTGGCNRPINRVMLTQLYSNGHTPFYQWTDDLEIWDGVP